MSLIAKFLALVVRLLGMKPDKPRDEHEGGIVEAPPKLYVVANRPCVKEGK